MKRCNPLLKIEFENAQKLESYSQESTWLCDDDDDDDTNSDDA